MGERNTPYTDAGSSPISSSHEPVTRSLNEGALPNESVVLLLGEDAETGKAPVIVGAPWNLADDAMNITQYVVVSGVRLKLAVEVRYLTG